MYIVITKGDLKNPENRQRAIAYIKEREEIAKTSSNHLAKEIKQEIKELKELLK